MRSRLLIALLCLVAAVALGLNLALEPGYVVISRGPWMVRVNLALFAVALIVGFMAAYVLLRSGVRAWSAPQRLRVRLAEHRRRRARRWLAEGLVALSEGDWTRAERRLTRDVARSDAPLLNYLGAARAAHSLGSETRRAEYLRRAEACTPRDPVAVGLTRAQIELESRQTRPALATLTELRRHAPGNRRVNELMVQTLEEAGEWQRLLDLLPELRRRRMLSEAKADTLAGQACARLLEVAAQSSDAEAAVRCWEGLPSGLRLGEESVYTYARALVRAGRGPDAEPVLAAALERTWSGRLAHLYGLVASADGQRQLARAERWLRGREQDPMLLLTLGRLCLRHRLWGKARRYLETSVAAAPCPEAYRLLAEVHARLDERAAAAECARRGLELATDPDGLGRGGGQPSAPLRPTGSS
jgi:HemY protein